MIDYFYVWGSTDQYVQIKVQFPISRPKKKIKLELQAFYKTRNSAWQIVTFINFVSL